MQFRVAKSRCTYFIPAKYSIPHAICTEKLTSCLVLIVWCRRGVPRALRRNWFRSAYFMKGITITGGSFGCRNTPIKPIMFLCRSFLSNNASLMNLDMVLFSSGVWTSVFIATGVNFMLSSSSTSFNFPSWTLFRRPKRESYTFFQTNFKLKNLKIRLRMSWSRKRAFKKSLPRMQWCVQFNPLNFEIDSKKHYNIFDINLICKKLSPLLPTVWFFEVTRRISQNKVQIKVNE